MENRELRALTLRLSGELREGRFTPDFDLGKSEYLGASEELAEAYAARARPVLEAFRARGLVAEEEIGAYTAAALEDAERLADRLQALAETLRPD